MTEIGANIWKFAEKIETLPSKVNLSTDAQVIMENSISRNALVILVDEATSPELRDSLPRPLRKGALSERTVSQRSFGSLRQEISALVLIAWHWSKIHDD